MTDGGGSSRLRDRAASQFQRRRRQAQAGSTRLRDTAATAFQRRRQQAQRARTAVAEGAANFAGALDLDEGFVEPVQLDDRGEDIGFVPTDRGRETLAQRFAADRPFVDAGDTLVDADPREGTLTRTDPDRLDEIAQRAVQESAADAEFITAADLDAEVGPGGVEDITTRPGRRDEIGQRVAADLAADDPFADPGDFDVDVGVRGVEQAALTPQGERRRAARQFAAETPLVDVDPAADVRETDTGFGLTDPAERRLAARRFEDDFAEFGPGELDPTADVRATGDGFGLRAGPAREVAAADIDRQLPDLDVGPDDIELQPADGGGFEAIFETEVRR